MNYLKIIDQIIRKHYDIEEVYAVDLALYYFDKYRSTKKTNTNTKLLATTCYFFSLNWLLDNCPNFTVYCKLVSTNKKKLILFQLEVFSTLDYNLTPKDFHGSINEKQEHGKGIKEMRKTEKIH